jgi:hypothetical protein
VLNRPGATLVRSVGLALVLVVATATPAFAQEIDHSTTKLWHYWIAWVLVISFVLMAIALAFGYWWRVVRVPKR